MKMLKFGGPNLPKGRSTWYETHREGDQKRTQVRADPGHEVEAAKVLRWTVAGPEPAEDYYVAAGFAKYTKKSENKTASSAWQKEK